ncbi:hypothetical protein SDC9_125117 [bioreactor metagenome]|uniref:Uncharacterized protein n=1 Tax=bioreactor metagenome TaxID=1076179 RepID=A0A645CM71_9ZZZZ
MRGGNISAPHRNVNLVRHNKVNVPVKSGSGIPARRLRFVFQAHSQHIVFAVGIQKVGYIAMKRVVPQRPESRFLAIDIHTGFTHCPVEQKRYAAFAFLKVIYGE